MRNAEKNGLIVMKTCILPLAFFIVVGCSDPGEPFVAPPPDISITQLVAVPETTTVQGRLFNFYTFMARDFMPISPPDGKPLSGVVYITALDSLPITNRLSSDAVWIVYNQQVWKSWFSSQQFPPNEIGKHQLARIFNNGPKWGPHVFVDVIVRLTDAQGNTHLLRASKQWIDRTD
jgi:hypothetical protein